MFPLIGGIFVIGLIVAAMSGRKAGADAARGLIAGHRYKLTMRTDVRRAGATFAQLESLTARLAQLGFTSSFLEPIDSEPDPFVWDADAIWSGALKALQDGLNIFFLNASDVSERGDHHGRFDADLPPAEEETVSRMLQFETDPQKLRDMAASLRPQFPIAADALEARANAIASAPPGRPPPPPPPPPPPAPPPPQPQPQAPPAPPPPAPPPPPPPPPQPQQPDPGPPAPNQAAIAFDPGNVPRTIPAIPSAGHQITDAHRSHQAHLVTFYAHNDVIYPASTANLDPNRRALDTSNGTIQFLPSMVDGDIGTTTQLATWAFQRWSNVMVGTQLAEDGLPGPATTTALLGAIANADAA